MKSIIYILIAFNISSCAFYGELTPEEKKAMDRKSQRMIAEVVEPLFAIIESACLYHKEFDEWSDQEILKHNNSREIIYNDGYDLKIEKNIYFSQLEYAINIVVKNRNREDNKKECRTYISGNLSKEGEFFKFDDSYIVGESARTKEKIDYAKLFMFIDDIAHLVTTDQLNLSDQLTVGDSAYIENQLGGNENLARSIYEAFCAELKTEPQYCP